MFSLKRAPELRMQIVWQPKRKSPVFEFNALRMGPNSTIPDHIKFQKSLNSPPNSNASSKHSGLESVIVDAQKRF